LLRDDDNKYTIFPIKYADIWHSYINHEKLVWTADEVDLTVDTRDWAKLSDNDRYFVKHVLAFFAASDGIVMENLTSRFSSDVQIAEARAFYAVQIYIENQHSIMYSRLIETYILDNREKDQLFNAIQHFPAIQKKAAWAQQWIVSTAPFATRLVGFAIVEGLFFSGAFCCIYWLRERGVMPGLCQSNDFIARDEGLHTDFAILLYKHVVHQLPAATIYEIFAEAVDIEKQFITESLPCSLIGMNASLMSEYIEFVADRLIKQLGYDPMFNRQNPFRFMDRICLDNITNFFDARPSEYQKNIGNGDKHAPLTFTDDF
jgi:ribonucleotide reductase beta subunit family protein with ferritin-like domain